MSKARLQPTGLPSSDPGDPAASPPQPLGPVIARLLIAAGLGSLVAWAIWAAFPARLPDTTDIIGFPIHSNFNVEQYFRLYWIVVLIFPLATIATYGVLRAVERRFALPDAERARYPERIPTDETAPAEARSGIVGVLRICFVGLVFGLASAIIANAGSGWLLEVGVLAALAYAAVVLGAAALLRRVTATLLPPTALRAAINTLGMSVLVLALFGATASGSLTVQATGTVRSVSWMPPALAVVGFAVVLMVAILSLRRRPTPEGWRAVERWFLLLVSVPIAIFLLTSSVPGQLGPIDLFHLGEPIVASDLVRNGAFPWRDVYFVHGLARDGVPTLIGFELFEDSIWGVTAMSAVLVTPLLLVTNYYLMVYLFRTNWVFLAVTQIAALLGLIYEFNLVWFLVPVLLLMMGAVMQRPSWPRTVALSALLVAQVVLLPEGTAPFLAVAVAIVGYDIYRYDPAQPFTINFRMTLRCLVTGIGITVVWVGILLTQGALDDFVNFYLTFARDHELTSGIPLTWGGRRFWLWTYVPPALVLLTFFYLTTRILARRTVGVVDWVMGAGTLALALGYFKFLARADTGHAQQVFGLAIPILLYVGFVTIGWLERLVGRTRVGVLVHGHVTRFPLSVIAAVLVIVVSPLTPAARIDGASSQLRAMAANEPAEPRVGYSGTETMPPGLVTDMGAVLDALLDPGDTVMDFTNSPALFHYLLDWPPASRYFHVIMAIRESTQEDLISDLRETRPKIVVFDSMSSTGLPLWDNISNPVRHYEVSEYLLANYRPLTQVHGYLLMERSDLDLMSRLDAVRPELFQQPSQVDLYFATFPCDWGFSLERLSTNDPISVSRVVAYEDVSSDVSREVHFSGWAADFETVQPASTVVVADSGRVVSETTPSLHRPDVAVALNDETFALTGFDVRAPVDTLTEASRLRLYAIQADGSAIELGYGSAVAITPSVEAGPVTLIGLDGSSIPVRAGDSAGWVDTATMSEQDPTSVVRLTLPDDFQDYRALEIEFADTIGPNRFEVTSGIAEDPDHAILFSTSGSSSTTYRVPVASCSQWFGYSADAVYLRMQHSEPIGAVSLLD